LPTGRLIYHKDTSLDAQEVARRLAVAEGYTFGLYDAYMVNAVSSLRAGASGLSCIQGNLFPELIVWLCDHVHNPDYSVQVDDVQTFLVNCMDLVHTAYPTLAKYALQKRGLPISLYTRRETEPLTDDLKASFDALLAQLDDLTPSLYATI
jgi:4-hydroxy-tetrahydrodipicolinate synthase